MSRIIRVVVLNIIIASTLVLPVWAQVASTTLENLAPNTTVNESYKAVVKVNTFAMASGYNLSLYGSGSGVFISDSGLILTNNHVIDVQDDFDNSSRPAAYQICLPNNTTDEPDCSYFADLIAKNKESDIALLQLKPISGLTSISKVPFLNLNLNDSIQINDEITAIGYPGIGNGSVTVTKGVMSGKTEKYDKRWIKTDAVISFGSSGGAAVDKDGRLIGITSAGHGDLLGSLGYLINIASINSWLQQSMSKTPVPSALEQQLINFTRSEKKLKSETLYVSERYGFKLRRPEGWDFNITQEDSISIEKADDEEAGNFSMEVYQAANKTDMSQVDYMANELKEEDLAMMNILSQKNVKLAGRVAKKTTFGFSGAETEIYNYMIPVENNIFKITTFNGKDDQDKTEIESILNSLQIIPLKKPFKPIKKYSQANPAFSLQVAGDWSLFPDVTKNNPITIQNLKFIQTGVNIYVNKLPKELSRYSNDQWLKYSLEQVEKGNKNNLEVKTKIVQKSAHFKLNDKIKDVIRIESEVKDKKNKIIAYGTSLIIRRGDKNIAIVVSDQSSKPDKKRFKKSEQEVLAQMKSFELIDRKFGDGSPVVNKDSDGDGLSDVDETRYGTDPKKIDTDGDGFNDAVEVRTGYNPLGAGKLK